MDTIPKLVDCNLFATKQAARFVTQLYERHLAAVNVTSSQVTIFAVIDNQPGITMTELAKAVVMDRTSLVRAIQPLNRDGYVLQKQEPGSKKITLFLSKSGTQKYRDALPHWDAAQKEYEGMIGEERARMLRHELMAITQR
ncbi:MarR family winged helix-turn-helix transcriptional regulator [Herbaspirillum rhizosphaerae]|uniref:MarR family winged helix-turn-helix transcriptional regulator n=1 Tax=Herbaspirillum rhizosphaerae TaxID=346179 RepID=UPI00067E5EE3|nr:MarR family winged helix-turn-helix transcriptional regulator [Herbaspirillum rhizosphaerae]